MSCRGVQVFQRHRCLQEALQNQSDFTSLRSSTNIFDSKNVLAPQDLRIGYIS